MVKPVPILVVNGLKDEACPYKGALYKGANEQIAPVDFAVQFFQEKYNCDLAKIP